MIYPIYADAGNRSQAATIIKTIRIKGGANVRNKYTLATPTGVVTEVSDEDLALLQKDPAFKIHVAKGFMKVMSTEKVDVSDMEKKDRSAQLTDSEHAAVSATTATAGYHDQWKGQKGVGFQA